MHEWYRYTKDAITGNIVFGARILLRPNITPDHKKYIQWANILTLLDGDILLHGPFDFLSISSNNHSKNLVAPPDWLKFGDVCVNLSVLSPTIGTPKRFNPAPPIQHRQTSKRKRNT